MDFKHWDLLNSSPLSPSYKCLVTCSGTANGSVPVIRPCFGMVLQIIRQCEEDHHSTTQSTSMMPSHMRNETGAYTQVTQSRIHRCPGALIQKSRSRLTDTFMEAIMHPTVMACATTRARMNRFEVCLFPFLHVCDSNQYRKAMSTQDKM